MIQKNSTMKRYYELEAKRKFAKPAVSQGSMVEGLFTLPSIAHADPDMVSSFVANLSNNIILEHNLRYATNSLVLANADQNIVD